MNILVTGGAGYIGTALVQRLDKLPEVEQITVYDNLSRRNYNFFLRHGHSLSKVKVIRGEILDSRQLEKIVEKKDIVYHLAAKVTTPFADQDPHFFEQVNNWGTANLTYALEKSKVSKFIHVSSASVYGSSDRLVDETVTPDPKTFYGISKLRGEKYVERLASKMKTIIIRSGNVYGYNESMRFDSVVNKFMFEANYFNKITVNGSGHQYRAFIHIEQLVQVLSDLLQIDTIPSGIYNTVSLNLSINEITEIIKELYPDMEMIYINQDIRLRELKVNPELKLSKYLTMPTLDFVQALHTFKQSFTF